METEQPRSAAGIGSRILIVGPSCSGKSTLGELLAGRIGVPFVELDALHWKPNWVGSTDEEFVPVLAEATKGDGWVVSGQYTRVSQLVTWPRADTAIWLDFSFPLVARRIVARSWRRWRSKEHLWGTNYERFWDQLKLWDETSLLTYTWKTRKRHAERYLEAMAEPKWAHLRWVRLRSPREVEQFVATLERSGEG